MPMNQHLTSRSRHPLPAEPKCSGSETELHQSTVHRARACELVSDTVEPVSAFRGRKRFSGAGQALSL
jgi:hypothetical protein